MAMDIAHDASAGGDRAGQAGPGWLFPKAMPAKPCRAATGKSEGAQCRKDLGTRETPGAARRMETARKVQHAASLLPCETARNECRVPRQPSRERGTRHAQTSTCHMRMQPSRLQARGHPRTTTTSLSPAMPWPLIGLPPRGRLVGCDTQGADAVFTCSAVGPDPWPCLQFHNQSCLMPYGPQRIRTSVQTRDVSFAVSL